MRSCALALPARSVGPLVSKGGSTVLPTMCEQLCRVYNMSCMHVHVGCSRYIKYVTVHVGVSRTVCQGEVSKTVHVSTSTLALMQVRRCVQMADHVRNQGTPRLRVDDPRTG